VANKETKAGHCDLVILVNHYELICKSVSKIVCKSKETYISGREKLIGSYSLLNV
jgi:hypothetical protein